MKRNRSYTDNARSDARDMVEEFKDQIVEQLRDNGEASTDYNNDYPNGDAYHHEMHVDREYSLTEAAKLLEELGDEYKEDDHGLWRGLEPRRAISAQAAYTYGNAVGSMWCDLIDKINEAYADSDEKPGALIDRVLKEDAE